MSSGPEDHHVAGEWARMLIRRGFIVMVIGTMAGIAVDQLVPDAVGPMKDVVISSTLWSTFSVGGGMFVIGVFTGFVYWLAHIIHEGEND